MNGAVVLRSRRGPVATFSIVARDDRTGDLGIAVASKFLAVGAVVPWARAGAGAIATQAHANVAYGPEGLDRLAAGAAAPAVLERLLAADPGSNVRQCGIVDAKGEAAAHTGGDCMAWAGHVVGKGFTCQGNILAGPEVVEAMATAFQAAPNSAFADRLLDALRAGELAGGDRRGRQSAALLVVREGGGYGGGNDRWVDLRVEDHNDPLAELGRLLALHRVYFPHDDTHPPLSLTAATLAAIAQDLVTLDYLASQSLDNREAVLQALGRFAGVENLEERLRDDDLVDADLVAFLSQKARVDLMAVDASL